MRSSFAALFKNRIDSFIRKPETYNWRRQSKFNYFTDENLLAVADLQVERPVAVSLDRRSHLAVLSVRAESTEIRNAIQANLVKELRAIGVEKPCAYIVNEFGEINIYLCFDEEFNARQLHPLLKNWLIHCEMDQCVGLVESGEPLELPLQKDFVWTTNYSTPLIRRGDIALEPAIAMFLSNLSKGLLSLETVTGHLSAFPVILAEEPPEVEEEAKESVAVPEKVEEEFPGENIVSLARKREERILRKEQEEVLLEELDSIEETFDLKDAEAGEPQEESEDLDFEPSDSSEDSDEMAPEAPASPEVSIECEEEQDSEEAEEVVEEFFSEALGEDEDQTLFEEMVDFNLNDIPARPGQGEEARNVEQSRGGDSIMNQSSTMLPPPGASSFKQLTIPFFTGE